MLFISRHRSPSFVMLQGRRDVIDTNMGKVVMATKPTVIQFSPLQGAFNTNLLPPIGNKREARGSLRTEVVARKLAEKNQGFFDDNGNDVTEDRVVSFLFTHREYGREFVAIGADGSEVKEEDQVFIPEGDEGGYYCTVCDKHLKNLQAKEGHKTSSKAHKSNFESRSQDLRLSLNQAAR